ncbi:MAG: PQQ-binding-like beta-propeller repeat protein [Ignavibacteriae bacterium]|nr:PQQ-binding-like beta-propeller repeat protein [Ignavibacteriota bacterium]
MTFGKIILDASPSSSYNGSSLSYLWSVVKKPNEIGLNIKGSTSVICEIEIPKIHGEYIISLQVTDSEGNKSLTIVSIANEILWKYKTGNHISSSPAIGNDETIYIGSAYNLYAVNPDGTKNGNFKLVRTYILHRL